jgi:hypothetical protein
MGKKSREKKAKQLERDRKREEGEAAALLFVLSLCVVVVTVRSFDDEKLPLVKLYFFWLNFCCQNYYDRRHPFSHFHTSHTHTVQKHTPPSPPKSQRQKKC